jgi:hypothetical protein
MTIYIKKSETADTRTCDYKTVSEQTLLASSSSHIVDVVTAGFFFREDITRRFYEHDTDKFTEIIQFHKDFTTGFAEHTWWDNHKKISRHHLHEKLRCLNIFPIALWLVWLAQVDDLQISNELLQMAFKNTVNLLKQNVKVVEK